MLEMAAVGTFLSFCKFIYFGFLRSNPEIEAHEAPVHMRVAMIVTAAFCVGIGMIPRMLTAILPYDMGEVHFYAAGHTMSTIMLLGTALVIFKLATKAYSPHKRLVADFDYFYRKLAQALKWLCVHPISAFSDMIAHFVPALLTDIWLPLSNSTSRFSALVDRLIFSLLTDMWLPLAKPISRFSAFIDEVVSTMLTDTWLPLSRPISRFSEALSTLVERSLPVKTRPAAETLKPEGEAIIQEEPHFAPPPHHPAAEDFPTRPSSRFSFKFERPRPKKERTWQAIAATMYLLFSNIAAKFDFSVVDGVVNGISRLAHGISKISLLFDTEVIERFINGTAKTVDYSSNLFKRTQTGRVQNYLLAILLGMLTIVTLYLLGILELAGIY
jgi:hypothetical protein